MRKKLILTKIREIEESLKVIEEHLPENLETFSEMGLSKDGIYKHTEFCIQEVIDICSIINSDLEFGIPDSESSVIDNLVENNVLNKELGMKIKRMRGFRNVLVHRYGRIDDKQAFKSIRNGIEDFKTFIREIDKLIS